MSHHLLGAAALALGIGLFGATPLAAQRTDSVAAPHVMAAVVVNASSARPRASAVENARLRRQLSAYDARIVALQLHLDSLKTYADSLNRDRVHFEAAAAEARARRTRIEQRLRELDTRSASPANTSTP